MLTMTGLESSGIRMVMTDWMVLGKVYGPHACDRFAFWSGNLGFVGAFCGGVGR